MEVVTGDKAGLFTQKESGFIQEIAQEAALGANCNVWVDGSLRDHKWYAAMFADIRPPPTHQLLLCCPGPAPSAS